MPSRAVAILVVFAALGGTAAAQTPAASAKAPAASSKAPAASAQAPAASAKEPSVQSLAARERQKTCGAEWRALSAAEKTSQGPKWPQYYSKCVKRLKEVKA
ncbi:hypothetical protein [Methylobacterium oryzihabitans]|uniref:Uncharacterized protein n=1 Tax=Methylobacterium oryzihabitans TaxID=2499852 RepID=A0A437PHL1_9HYPH|nr:hypothetical protein [Methylobacterium oryzihabitans]RVU21748.1 hypothetical protein EOE48_01495 [Methylobacterium oryzihabitans]